MVFNATRRRELLHQALSGEGPWVMTRGVRGVERDLAAAVAGDASLLPALLAELAGEDDRRASAAARVLGLSGRAALTALPQLRDAVARPRVGEDAIEALVLIAGDDEALARDLLGWWRSLPDGDPEDERRLRIFEALPRFRRHVELLRPLFEDARVRQGWWSHPYADGRPEIPVRDQEHEVLLVARHVGLELPGSESCDAPDGWRLRGRLDRWPRSW